MRKSDVTGSVASVRSSELLSQPITNALEGLQGRVAGVDIALNSGAPGGIFITLYGTFVKKSRYSVKIMLFVA